MLFYLCLFRTHSVADRHPDVFALQFFIIIIICCVQITIDEGMTTWSHFIEHLITHHPAVLQDFAVMTTVAGQGERGVAQLARRLPHQPPPSPLTHTETNI